MTQRKRYHGLDVDTRLARFIDDEMLPAIGVASDTFWQGFDEITRDLAPKNLALLAERDRLQTELDAWHRAHPGPLKNDQEIAAHRQHLESIGYLVKPPASVRATTANVDDELALQAGPQLVVPILNARYSLNAANARWGSLYDALYGTDAIDEANGSERGTDGRYNVVRGARVIAYAREFLDTAAPLANGSHADATKYAVEHGKLIVSLKGSANTQLADPTAFIGYQGKAEEPSSILLRHNGLHIDIVVDYATPIGAADGAGVSDVVLEAALSTILDLEDSIAAVDAEDKTLALPQLARHSARHVERIGQQRRQDLYARTEPGPPLHRAGWQWRSAPAWPLADVPAQCRASDDEPGHSV